MISIPAGCVPVGCALDDTACDAVERPGREACLDAFRMDRTEVTVADYDACVAAGACPARDHGRYCTDGVLDPLLPATCVSWAGADAYCRHAGKRLPTEAEWERAARGSAGGIFPWGGDQPNCERVVTRSCGAFEPARVCSKPAGNTVEGACDMGGNVWEWVADWFSDKKHSAHGIKNPKGPCDGKSPCKGFDHRVFKGGGYDGTPSGLRASFRHHAAPDTMLPILGFRCATQAESPGTLPTPQPPE